MDKSCQTCAHAGTPTYKSPCSECVASGTFEGWTARTCENCKHRGRIGDGEPCHTCFKGKSYSMWERMPTDVELAQTAEDMKPDNVNHPAHYTSGCGFECIEMMEMVFGKEAVHDFCTLNAFRYLWRYRQKGGADDIGKAKWYLEYTKGLNVFKNRQAIDKMRENISKEEANK